MKARRGTKANPFVVGERVLAKSSLYDGLGCWIPRGTEGVILRVLEYGRGSRRLIRYAVQFPERKIVAVPIELEAAP